MRTTAYIFAASLLVACAAAPENGEKLDLSAAPQALPQQSPEVVIRLDNGIPVDFRGIINKNDSSQSGAMMYSGAAGAGGLLAQVMLHAAISSSAQEAKARDKQEAANQVLTPLQLVLEGFLQEQLLHSSESYQFIDNDEEPDANFVVDSHPVYYVSQNIQFVSLRNAVSIQAKGNDEPIYTNVIEVMAPRVLAAEPLLLLKENNGATLVSTARQLYVDSLTLALADFRGELTAKKADAKHQTHRIPRGDDYRVERGLALASAPDDVVIRNLRGWIIAYPLE